jgi:hypothetical protein
MTCTVDGVDAPRVTFVQEDLLKQAWFRLAASPGAVVDIEFDTGDPLKTWNDSRLCYAAYAVKTAAANNVLNSDVVKNDRTGQLLTATGATQVGNISLFTSGANLTDGGTSIDLTGVPASVEPAFDDIAGRIAPSGILVESAADAAKAFTAAPASGTADRFLASLIVVG